MRAVVLLDATYSDYQAKKRITDRNLENTELSFPHFCAKGILTSRKTVFNSLEPSGDEVH
jgi:hypothetical protein